MTTTRRLAAILAGIDGYFEETNVVPIRVGDPASIKLMGYFEVVRGHVDRHCQLM